MKRGGEEREITIIAENTNISKQKLYYILLLWMIYQRSA